MVAAVSTMAVAAADGCVPSSTIVLYSSATLPCPTCPALPYLPELAARLPTVDAVDVSDALLLDIEDAEQATCARSLMANASTLVLWEGGSLGGALASAQLPPLPATWPGHAVMYGKEGRALAGMKQVPPVLSGLQSVGSLSVYNMDGLKNMTGLESLQTVEQNLAIGRCGGLISLAGLSSLTTIGGDLLLVSNEALKDLDGLQNLVSVGARMSLSGNGVLMDLTDLTSLKTVGVFSAINNGADMLSLPASAGPSSSVASSGSATDVVVVHGWQGPPDFDVLALAHDDAIPPVDHFVLSKGNVRYVASTDDTSVLGSNVRGNVIIWDDGLLSNLSVFSGVESVGGQLLILGAEPQEGATPYYQQQLTGMESLRSVGGLNIVRHDGLRTLRGLSALSKINGSIVLHNCALLKTFQGLNSNADDLPPPRPAAGASIESMRAALTAVTATSGGSGRRLLAAPKHLTVIGSSLWLRGLPMLTDLNGPFKHVKVINWNVRIERCPNITSLDGLASLTTIGGELALVDNAQLEGCGGLSSLASVGVSVVVAFNPAFSDLSCLRRLTSIKGDLLLTASNISSLTELNDIKSVKLNLVLSDLPMTDVNGLGALQTVGYKLVVSRNPSLTSVDGMGSLNRVGEAVYVEANPQLGGDQVDALIARASQ
ncbi:hypothetical protein FOA52_011686 [Chlamydomonas sp. UWO 241]|nr:hypothetical protein FOA52_011686 [Chlamydomonas sp. UWO 241]